MARRGASRVVVGERRSDSSPTRGVPTRRRPGSRSRRRGANTRRPRCLFTVRGEAGLVPGHESARDRPRRGRRRRRFRGFGIDPGCRGRRRGRGRSGDAPAHGRAESGRKGAGRSVEDIGIRSPDTRWKIGRFGRTRGFRNGGAPNPVEGFECNGCRSLPGRRGIVPRRLRGIPIFVEDRSRIRHRRSRRGEPPFLVGQVYGDRSDKANDSGPGLVVVVVKKLWKSDSSSYE